MGEERHLSQNLLQASRKDWQVSKTGKNFSPRVFLSKSPHRCSIKSKRNPPHNIRDRPCATSMVVVAGMKRAQDNVNDTFRLGNTEYGERHQKGGCRVWERQANRSDCCRPLFVLCPREQFQRAADFLKVDSDVIRTIFDRELLATGLGSSR